MTRFITLLAAGLVAATAATTATAQAGQGGARLDRYVADVQNRNDTSVRLGRIVADAAGVVEIYDYNDGRQGALLATRSFAAGNNLNVRVALDTPRRNALLAVLKIDGAVVSEEVIRWLPEQY